MKIDLDRNYCIVASGMSTFDVNGKDISKSLADVMPEDMKDFKNYPATISIHIEILGRPLDIKVSGHKAVKKEDTPDEDAPTEDDTNG